MSETNKSVVKKNLVANELLAYIQNKLNEMDTQFLLAICSTNFNLTEILKAKKLVASYVTVTYPEHRRAKNPELKVRRHIQDIIRVLENADPNYIPTFVAQDLSKFLPASSIDFNFKYLLKDVIVLKNEIFSIRASVETTELATYDLSRKVVGIGIEKGNAGGAIHCSRINEHVTRPESEDKSSLSTWADNSLTDHTIIAGPSGNGRNMKSKTNDSKVIENQKYEKTILFVNELLAFVQNKINEMDKLCLLEICIENFTPREIKRAKKLIASVVKVTYPKARGPTTPIEAARRNIQDVIRVFERTDPNHLPTFVVQDLSRFLPMLSINLTLKHLLKDVMMLKEEVYAIRGSVEGTELATQDLRRMMVRIENEMAEGATQRATSKQAQKPEEKYSSSWADDIVIDRNRVQGPSENRRNVKEFDVDMLVQFCKND